MKAGQRAIAYLRVSVVGDRAARGRLESPELQRDAIDGWCASRGITVVGEIRDLNRSGGTLTRPGLGQALQALSDGDADGIVVARSDRASRRTLHGLGMIDDLERQGFWIAAVDGTIDTTDRIRRMATTMHFAMAESELERFREQSAIIHRRAITEKGRHMGPAPFGYRRDKNGRLTLDDREAGVVRDVFEMRADGMGMVTIARALESRGVRQANGRRLGSQFVRRMLDRRAYLGEAHHGEHLRPNAHPAIIDDGLWTAAHRAAPAVRSSPRTPRTHPESLLRGLLRCSGCRYVLKRIPEPTGIRWGCRAKLSSRTASWDCEHPAAIRQTDSPLIDDLVVAEFFRLASGVAAERDMEHVDVPALERAASEAEALLDELSSLDVRRELGAVRWSRLVSDARSSLEEAERGLAVARAARRAQSSVERATLEEAWSGMTLNERQAALGSVIQAVMVDEGDGPISGRVHVIAVWEPVELPRQGSSSFVARRWRPGDD